MKILNKIYIALMPKSILNELNKTMAKRTIDTLKVGGVNLSAKQKLTIMTKFNVSKKELKDLCLKK